MFFNMKYAVAILFALLVVGAGFVKYDWLFIKTNQGEIVKVAPIASHKEFFIRFTHSVALTPVDEFFVADAGQIVLKRTIYHDFGAGLPHMAEGAQKMVFEDGKITISGFDLRMQTLHVRVGRIAKHIIYLPNVFANGFVSIRLDTFVKPGQALALSVEKMSFWRAFWFNWQLLS